MQKIQTWVAKTGEGMGEILVTIYGEGADMTVTVAQREWPSSMWGPPEYAERR